MNKNKMERKLFLNIAMSMDGYIANLDDDLSFLSIVEKPGEDYGYVEFISTIDTVIIGRKTYDWVSKNVGFPHTDKETFVITRCPKPKKNKIVFYTGDLIKLVRSLKVKKGHGIFCDGGAEIVNLLFENKLIDELIISIIPVLLGNGKKLFNDGRPEQKLILTNSKIFDSGLAQLHYQVIFK